MANSIRETAVQAIITAIQGITPDSGATLLFKEVRRGEQEGVRVQFMPFASVEEGEEEVEQMITSRIDKLLPIIIQFQFAVEKGVDHFERFNYYLAHLQKGVLSDSTLLATVINIIEVGNTPEIDVEENTAGGFLILQLKYRHEQIDPFTR